MSRETRTVRPFLRTSLDESLREVTFRFGDQTCEADRGITVDDAESFAINTGEIIWTPEVRFEGFKDDLRAGATELEIDLPALGLLAVASTSYIKRSEVVHLCPLDDLDRLTRVTDITAGARPVALRTGFHGAVVEVYLVLLRTLAKRPLRPWRKGTWIARAGFRIDVHRGADLFHLTPLDNEQRDRRGLPSGCVRFVDLDNHDICAPFGDSEPPRFYVDEELLRQLSARQRSAAAQALQAQLAYDFVVAVIHHAAADSESDDSSWEDVEDSLLGRVLGFTAGPGASTDDKQQLLKSVSGNPERIIASVEHAIDIGTRMIGSLKDGS